MVRAQFKKLEEAAQKAAAGGDTESGGKERESLGDPGLMAIVSMELSRVCPGFCLAFGASLGLAGGAIMSKGTLAQKQQLGAADPDDGEDRRLGHDRAGRRLRRLRLDAHDRAPRRRSFRASTGRRRSLPTRRLPIPSSFTRSSRATRSRDIGRFTRSSSIRGRPGYRFGKPMDKMGMHSSPTGEVFLSDVRVPAEQLLGGKLEEHSREAGARRLSRRAHRNGADVPRNHRALSRGFAWLMPSSARPGARRSPNIS